MKKIVLLACAALLLIVNCVKSKVSNETVAANDTCAAIDQYLTTLSAEKNFSGGLLIIQSGKKVFSKGYGWADRERKISFNANTLASIGSITKLFTAAAVMKLYEQKKLSLDDPLKKFFPDVPTDKGGITIHQLLTHSSGFSELMQNDGGDYEKIETREYLKRAFSEPLSFRPGEKAVYTNVGMSILAIIIEQVSGMEYEAFLKKNLFDLAGIKNIGYCYPAAATDTIAVGYKNGQRWGTHQQRFKDAGGGPYWNLKGNGGLEASLNDMFLWANAFTNHAFLSDASIQKMFTPHIEEDGTNGMFHFGYGCNIRQSRRNTKVIDNGGSNGIYFARLLRLPQEGMVFYLVTNESALNANMVLPNVTQLWFEGKISRDAVAANPRFETPLAAELYKIITEKKPADLAEELNKANISVDDDMILLDVGQKLIEEKKISEALVLYKYYTKQFPKIVVAWNDLGDVYQMLGNKEEAITCYKQALSLRPGNPRAKENLERLTK